MSHLPVIVGFGGINSSGRSSFHHGYRRLVIDRLTGTARNETFTGLASLMGLIHHREDGLCNADGQPVKPGLVEQQFGDTVLENTLLRRISGDLFEADRVSYNRRIRFQPGSTGSFSFQVSRKELPIHIPDTWVVEDAGGTTEMVEVTVNGSQTAYLPDERKIKAQTGAQLPTGFDPSKQYTSKHHPRGLQMAVYAATDAVRSVGMEWQDVLDKVEPDHIGVYASSAMGQLDASGTGGMMKAGSLGQRTSSKQLAMGLVQMPADFINAYILGNLGHTSAQVGACATLLYNLYAAVKDIQSGKRKVAIVGSSEAPLIPEVIEGYRAMSALGDDAQILRLDGNGKDGTPDYYRACRPFSDNCGFALGESAQYFILFADDLVMETGVQVFGAVGDVFINADGFKKSISQPGFGNYISLAKAAALTRSVVGDYELRHQTFVSAHGTGTPQNRTTESHGLNEIARVFKIENWPVAAIKCYIGHSLGPASGDQLAAVLGTWRYGLIPGIATLDRVAEDVHQSNLLFSRAHIEVDIERQSAALINSKGFGGNNGTGVILSPATVLKMLKQRYGLEKMLAFQKQNEAVADKAEAYNQEMIKGRARPIYRFGEDILGEADLNLDDQSMKIPGYRKRINLKIPSPYLDMGSQEIRN